MPARKVVTRRGRRFRGYFPSRKLGRMVAWESLLERDAILLLEFSSGVVSYREQPVLIEYFDGQQIRGYYPDFEADLTDGDVLHVEVKASFQLAKPKIESKFRVIAADYRRRQHDFRIITEAEIRREPMHSNLKNLARYSRHCETLESTRRQISFLLKDGALPMNALGLDDACIWRLLACGYLHCNLAAPIMATTLLSLQGGGDDAALLF
ncbi:MAG: TnsA endonuclease N-terminal domain-containing protein [Candidatus Accumulibacter sp.]|nr:TnsA endonuclease N-terminal domain-containing protein [Accumulibacter sp.]